MVRASLAVSPFRVALASLLLVCVPLAPAAFAEPAVSITPQQAVALQGQVCAAVCRKRYVTCAASKPAAGLCDTNFVDCNASCPKCVGVFDQCVGGKDGSPRSCQVPFIACMRTALAAPAAGRSAIRFEGGDGTTQKNAVVIVGARNEIEGIIAEGLWAMKTHPDWSKRDQALLKSGGRSFDKIGYTTPRGPREAWFDITGFFGKM